MPCPHKFACDLNLERLDFKPATLIIGTFNPSWESLNNYADWFYGRTHNNYFWDVLPQLYGVASLRKAQPADWKVFCRNNKIALTDLIYRIDDADSGNPAHVQHLKTYRDDAIARHFRRFTTVNVPSLLENNPSIAHIYLTRGASGFWRQLWQPVSQHCRQRGKTAQTLLTPSGSARFQMIQGVDNGLSDFILKHWQTAWHDLSR